MENNCIKTAPLEVQEVTHLLGRFLLSFSVEDGKVKRFLEKGTQKTKIQIYTRL